MIKEIKREKESLDEKKLKEIIAGLTGQHGKCSCDNCGEKQDNNIEHSENTPV